MPPERFPPEDPREWMNRALSSLTKAKAKIPDVYLEDLCFDAQQAAEKALKALLLARGIVFPYVHDLAELLTLLENAGETIPAPVKEAGRLSRFAVTTRYPGVTEPVTEQEYQRAITTAEGVVQWVTQMLGTSS